MALNVMYVDRETASTQHVQMSLRQHLQPSTCMLTCDTAAA
jgi:hypothetical protein